MKEKHLFTSDFKLKFCGYGEWVEEPDLVEFTYNGIDCRIHRILLKEPYAKEEVWYGGHLCGAIRIPEDHALYKKDWLDISIDCHGGLMFAEKEKDGYWIGFKCMHIDDITPSMEILRKRFQTQSDDFYNKMKEAYPDCHWLNPTYKSISYCIAECKSMADQLLSLEVNK